MGLSLESIVKVIIVSALTCGGVTYSAAEAIGGDSGKDLWNVREFGAVGDGKTDDTAAFQKALDTAGKAGGGTVYAPRGNYLFAGHLNVPQAVTLAGMWQSVPAHNGIRDQGLPKPMTGRHF